MITSRMMDWAAKRQAVPPRHRQQDRRGERRPARRCSPAIQAAFGKECLPINLPAGGGKRVVDCFFNPSGESDFSSVADAHRALVDQVVEVDEELMSLYLEQGEVAPDQLHAPFEKALREGHLVPVCFVSARTGAGIRRTARRSSTSCCPIPTEGNPPLLHQGRGRGRRRIPLGARSREARARARVQGRDGSVRRQARHLPRAPGHRHARHAALRRRRRASRSRSATCSCCRAARTSRSTARCPATSPRSRRSTTSSSTACCTIRTTRTTSTCSRSNSRRRCTASRSSPSAAATSSGSPTCCTG